jgi:signal peptidase I
MEKEIVFEQKTTVKKNKFIAAILNLFFLGAGYLYIGNIKKAILTALSLPILLFGCFYIVSYITNAYTVVLPYLFIGIFYIYIIIDVIKQISIENIVTTKYSKWYFILLFFILADIFILTTKSISPINLLSMPSASMSNTIIVGDNVLVRKDSNMIPERGDVVVFKYPKNENIQYAKRIVAISGDLVALKNKHLYIHPKEGNVFVKANYPAENIIEVGDKLWVIDPYMKEHPGIHNDDNIVDNGLNPKELFNMMPIIVPYDETFMMGDNRDHSNDSRFWGTVPNKNIIGKITHIFTNFNDFNRLGMKLD